MGLMDKITGAFENNKDKIADAVDQHGDKIEQGVDRAGDFIDDKTGGKFSDQIDQGQDKLKDGLDSLDGKDDDFGAEAPPADGSAGDAPTTDGTPDTNLPPAPQG